MERQMKNLVRRIVALFAVAAVAFLGVAVLKLAPPWLIAAAITAGITKVLIADRRRAVSEKGEKPQ